MERFLDTPPHFKRTVRKIGEKVRVIHEPDKEAEAFHALLLKRLYERGLLMPNATGGMPNKSLADNIKPHAGNRLFYMLDIENAYPSLNGNRLAAVVSRLGGFGSERHVKEWFDEYCLDPETNGLILGAPCSQYLFNIYCRDMDKAVQAYCAKAGLTYTRYLDDLTVSAPPNTTIGIKRRAAIREKILIEGWRINHGKSRLHSLDNGPVTVTGISLYPDGYWKLSPELVEKITMVFDELEAKIKNQYGWLSDKDEGRLHGYYGILTSTYDDRRGHPTAIEKKLIKRYQELRSHIRQKGRKAGKVATQKTLFNPYVFAVKAERWWDSDRPVKPRSKPSKYKTDKLLD